MQFFFFMSLEKKATSIMSPFFKVLVTSNPKQLSFTKVPSSIKKTQSNSNKAYGKEKFIDSMGKSEDNLEKRILKEKIYSTMQVTTPYFVLSM